VQDGILKVSPSRLIESPLAGHIEMQHVIPFNISQNTKRAALGYQDEPSRAIGFEYVSTDAADFGLLDSYTKAGGAYSLRSLSIASKYVVRVCRDSDDAEMDFTAEGIDDGTLETWVGIGNNGYVSIWYDQSGQEHHATQTTQSKQPAIVTSGSLIMANGRPAIQPDGIDDYLDCGGLIVELSAGDVLLSTVHERETAGDGHMITEADNLGTYSSNFVYESREATEEGLSWVNSDSFGDTVYGSQVIGQITEISGTVQAYLNNVSAGSSGTPTVNTEAGTTILFSRGDGTTAFYGGKVQEIVSYKTDKSSERAQITKDQNLYYSAYSGFTSGYSSAFE